MKALRLSGEKAAAVAPVINRSTGLLWLLWSKINTWFGLVDVSDTTILVPLGETASTLPVTLLNAETGFVVLPTLAKVITINPFSLPRNAVFPCLSKSSELGVFGRVAAPPNVFAGIAIETIELVQAKFVPHPVLATHTVPLGVALGLTVTEMELFGYMSCEGTRPALHVGGMQDAVIVEPPPFSADTVPPIFPL